MIIRFFFLSAKSFSRLYLCVCVYVSKEWEWGWSQNGSIMPEDEILKLISLMIRHYTHPHTHNIPEKKACHFDMSLDVNVNCVDLLSIYLFYLTFSIIAWCRLIILYWFYIFSIWYFVSVCLWSFLKGLEHTQNSKWKEVYSEANVRYDIDSHSRDLRFTFGLQHNTYTELTYDHQNQRQITVKSKG